MILKWISDGRGYGTNSDDAVARCYAHGNETLNYIKGGEFIEQLSD